MDDYPSHSLHSIFQELTHLKREPLSSIIYSYPNVTPTSGTIYHLTMVSDSCTQYQAWKNVSKLEADPGTSHCDFYLSEDEMTYLNEIFKTDPVIELPLERNTNKQVNRGAEGTIHSEQKINNTEARKSKSGTSKRAMRASRFTKSSTLEREEIKKYFDLPINLAAKKMNVGLTVLKKRCRELNIMRWPHRKIKSLKSLISNVKELGLEKETEMLEEHRMILEKMPQVELTEKTKKLRQACFKANYKRRRQMQASSRCCSSYTGNC